MTRSFALVAGFAIILSVLAGIENQPATAQAFKKGDTAICRDCIANQMGYLSRPHTAERRKNCVRMGKCKN